ncbi:hypothetical protein G9A89_006092 [Geosiphon pyriformis]|nr:hypothetical protein G9A89_006092 [Geosiphon pyriformis]
MAYAPITKLNKFTGKENDVQNAVTQARNFESAKLEANYTYAINLVMNRLSKLDSKLKQFSDSINQKSNYLSANDTATNLSTASISTSNLSTTATSNLLATTPRSRSWNSGTGVTQNPNFQNYLSLLVSPEDVSANNLKSAQKQPLPSNIPPVTITKDESLTAIFPFKFEETTITLLFSEATLEAKLITVIYIDAKVDEQSIKLILDSSLVVDRTASARILTADEATKTPISKIDEFPFEVNGIITPIKVLVIEATQYQALVGNNWLFKTNAVLDWTTQELQLSINGQHTRVPAMCGHFKILSREEPLIELEEEEKKPIWKAYQVSWADNDHNKLPLILSWNDKGKRKEEKELIWGTNQKSWSDNGQSEPATEWS